MKYLLTLLITTTLLTNSLLAVTPDEECYKTAVHLMMTGDYYSAIQNFELVLASNPSHCEALDYITECSLALLLNAECKDDALKFAEQTINYASKSQHYFPEEGNPIYYSVVAKNQAALWNFFYDDFSSAEYLIYEHFENHGDEMLGWYALGDYFLTCSYFPERQILKSYNNEITNSGFFEVSLDCLMEDANYAFQRATDYYSNGVFGNYGLMEIALYKKDMEALRQHYAAIQHKEDLHPLEATLQYFAVVLYDDCLIDDFYEEIDIETDDEEYLNGNLIGAVGN